MKPGYDPSKKAPTSRKGHPWGAWQPGWLRSTTSPVPKREKRK